MAKYSVGVLDGFDIDSTVETVYKGNNVIQAIKVWATESIKNPTMVAIYTTRKAYADMFYEDCRDNIERIKEICNEDKFPYKWEYIEKGIEKGTDFKEYKLYDDIYAEDQLYPFCLG